MLEVWYIICWWFLFSSDRNGISVIWFEVVVIFTYACVRDTHTGTHALYLIHMCTNFQFNCISCSLILILLPVVCLSITAFETFPQPEAQKLQKTVAYLYLITSMLTLYLCWKQPFDLDCIDRRWLPRSFFLQWFLTLQSFLFLHQWVILQHFCRNDEAIFSHYCSCCVRSDWHDWLLSAMTTSLR